MSLSNNFDSNISYFTDLVQTHFEAVNEIYNEKVHRRFLRHPFSSCPGCRSCVWILVHLSSTRTAQRTGASTSRYLTSMTLSEFCLAYMFISWISPLLGLLAWHPWALCRSRQNSGSSHSFNNGRWTDLSTTPSLHWRELGHSLGAQHDEDAKDEDCGQKHHGSHDMNALVEEFSTCSARTMQDKLNMVLEDTKLNCLVTDDESPQRSIPVW